MSGRRTTYKHGRNLVIALVFSVFAAGAVHLMGMPWILSFVGGMVGSLFGCYRADRRLGPR